MRQRAGLRARRQAARALHAWRRRRFERRLAGPKLLATFAECHPRAFFIEIGSNDGEQHDHLRPFILTSEWSGIMVEPVPYIFERLERNYGQIDRVILENAAISDRTGRVPFYYLVDASADERAGLPDWYDGIGSLSEDAVLSHVDDIPDVENRIIRADVPALTFEELCDRHGAERVDLLVVDTEGYDWELIRTIDFERRRPELLIYEHFHLAPEDRAEAAATLERAGYSTMEEGFDTFCLADDASPRLQRLWPRLRPGMPGLSVHEK